MKIKLITKIVSGHFETLHLYSEIEGKSRYTSIKKKDNAKGETIFRKKNKKEFFTEYSSFDLSRSNKRHIIRRHFEDKVYYKKVVMLDLVILGKDKL